MAEQKERVSLRVWLLVLVFIVAIPCLPLLITRRWDWWEAWVYAAITILGFAISRWLAARQHPDLLAERAQFMRQDDTEHWDKVLAPLSGLGGALIPLVAGLDALLRKPEPFGLTAKIVILAIIFAGYVVASAALIANRFFSGTVRIQAERGQHVVTGGPYRWVRHPGYAGALLTYWATPVLLDSLWAYLPVIFLTIVLVVRTSLEDKTLQERLEGYEDYASRVPHRLIPGLW